MVTQINQTSKGVLLRTAELQLRGQAPAGDEPEGSGAGSLVNGGSVQVEGAGWGRTGGVLFGLFEEFVEFAGEDVFGLFVLLEGFVEDFGAAGFFAFEFVDGFAEVFDDGGFFVFFVSDDGAKFGVDFEHGLAARAADFDQLALRFGHGDWSFDLLYTGVGACGLAKDSGHSAGAAARRSRGATSDVG